LETRAHLQWYWRRYELLASRAAHLTELHIAWYIPPTWLPAADLQPDNIVDAALLASHAVANSPSRHIDHSTIPLLLHQTWKNRRINSWAPFLCASVEKWLSYVIADDVAYFFWEDDGISSMLEEFEPGFVGHFESLPSNVERADVFRVLVLKWFGGIYGDIDTQPLKKPKSWISETDVTPWTDELESMEFASNQSAGIMLGIEADCAPQSNEYWRMGYSFPVQLTQWALASTVGHPILLRFMQTLQHTMDDVARRNQGDLNSEAAMKELRAVGPLSLTGPVAITMAAMEWLEEQFGLRWNALTGLHDGGRSKLVEDVLILPITGFSPGRGRYGNMGSKSITDPSARVWHRAQGSWRSFDPKVEFGKFCRTFLGMCKDWSKVSE
jgi:mannosyltransferase OCH1-like enzyme